jgi:hypothetical protein
VLVNMGQAMPAGSYFFMPAGMKHFVWTTGETVIQLSGASPSGINYLDRRTTLETPRNNRFPVTQKPTSSSKSSRPRKSVRQCELFTLEQVPAPDASDGLPPLTYIATTSTLGSTSSWRTAR